MDFGDGDTVFVGGVKTISVKLGRLPSNQKARLAPETERESDVTRSESVLGLFLVPAGEFAGRDQEETQNRFRTGYVGFTLGFRCQPCLLIARQAPEFHRDGLHAADEHGVAIAEVQPNSVAASKGLRRGEIILRVAGEEVNTPRQVERLIEEARRDGRRTVLLRVQSNRRVRFVGLPVKKG